MRKQTKPEVYKPEVYLDHYLETIGLWRKPVARDGLCLFRAVSEQLFMTQVYHTNLYEACKLVFLHCGKDMQTDWTELVVMEILSKMYRRDFIVYEDVGHLPTQMTNNLYQDKKILSECQTDWILMRRRVTRRLIWIQTVGKGNNKAASRVLKILLCRTSGNQLDSVYPSRFQQSSAVCQSILYELLYRDVFKLDSELTEAVTLIRDQNKKKMSLLSNSSVQLVLSIEAKQLTVKAESVRFDDLPDTITKRPRESPIRFREMRYLPRPTPPLPYRIAKALDPCIYRNVELDIWEESKREQKRESQEHRDKFAPGDKCQVILEGDRFCGHIQEIHNDDNTAVVFIEELGEKQSVAVSCLKISPFTRHSLYSRHKFQKQKQVTSVSPTSLGKSYYSKSSRVPAYQSQYQTGPLPVATDLDLSQNCEANQGYTFGQPYSLADLRMTNLNNPCVTMDTATLQGNVQNSKANLNQYASSMLQPYAAPGMSQNALQQGGYMYGPVIQQSNAGYAYVCVPYLESIAMRDVNINCHPSQDMAGKDLPEMNTLRFFYNLGVENYRNISSTGPNWPSMEMVPAMQSADQINGNVNPQFALPPPPLPLTSSPNSDNDKNQQPSNQNYLMCGGYSGTGVNKANHATGSPVLNPDKGDKASMGDESHDSGCDSDSASGIAQDESFKETEVKLKLKTTSIELEQKIDSYIAKDNVEIMEAESADAGASSVEYETQHTTRAKKPRKYYMYGNHKLIKPIKDIPPRFLSLLQSSSAERARCEGEPIIIPVLPRKWNQSYRNNGHQGSAATPTAVVPHNGFNPEAKCFIPNTSTQSLMQDPSIIACSTGPKNGQAVSVVDPYQPAHSQENISYSYSSFGNGVPMCVTSQLYPQTNPGAGSSVTNFPSSSNTGDGSKLSMPPSLLTGQACPSYPPSMQYPMYYAGQSPYNGTPGLMPPGLQGAVGFTPAYHQSQAFGMQPQVTQVPAVQAAQ